MVGDLRIDDDLYERFRLKVLYVFVFYVMNCDSYHCLGRDAETWTFENKIEKEPGVSRLFTVSPLTLV